MNPITQFVSPSALSATDSTQPSNQFSAPTWGSDKDQGDAYIYVPLKKTVDPKIIVIDSSDEDSSDDEPPDKTLSVHLLANGTASYASGESAGIHPESGSHFMASSCPPQQLDPAASAYPGTSTYICPPQPAAIALSPVNTWPPQHPGDIMWPSPMSHPNGSTSNHYNGSSDYHPNSGFFTYPPPQQANSSMTVYNPQQASTSTCSWSNTTTSLPRDSSSLYPNDVEMISAPASPRVTNMLDEVEDMEVDYPQNPFYQGSLARKRVWEAPLDRCGLAEGEPVPKKRPSNSFNVQALVHCFGSSTGNSICGSIQTHAHPQLGGIQSHSEAKTRKRVWEAPLDRCGLAEGEPVPKKRKMIVKVNRPLTRRRVR